MDKKYDLYLKIMINRYKTVFYKKRLMEEIRFKAKDKEIDLLFLYYVANSFFKEMILNTAHLFENNSSNNENVTLRRLLNRHLDGLKENTKKNKERIDKCNKLIDLTKKYKYDELSQVFDYRNGLLAHSDFKLFQKLLSKEKKFDNIVGEVNLALSHTLKVLR
ncbi:hypothetical protein [Paenibacillus elgii]|uniref:AbiU2 domain-containing protein n=1 Tax=Paenibacillus elgii TaxID=189691 RepID=UPI000248C6B4|nr:hypothetical protein [Paenibacillus elgii]